MAIKLIAIDIDGTLLDSRWQLPAANRAAIADAVARGVEVALVTGRRFDFARPIAEMFACPLTLIVSNGALIKVKNDAGQEAGATPNTAGREAGVTDPWRTELRRLLPRETAREILAATPGFREGAAVVFDRERENQVIFERIDWSDPGRRGYFERNRAYISQVAPLEACLTEDPIQVMFSGCVEPMRRCAAALRKLSENREAKSEKRKAESRGGQGRFALAVTEYEERDFSLVDAIRLGCSKGAALAEWTLRRGMAPSEVMAIGDNLNDREMLEFAGLAVVMGNSVPELKESGWAVTLSNDQAGVAAAIQEYVLGKAAIVRQSSIADSP